MNPVRTALSGITEARATIARVETANPHTAGQVRQAVGAVLVADGLVGLEVPGGKKSRPGIVGALGGVLMGLAFIAMPLFAFGLSPDTDASTTGTITAVSRYDDTCGLQAVFTVDGQEYRTSSTARSSSFCSKAVGDAIQVDYDSTDPGRSETADPTGRLVLMVFVAVGALIALVSLGQAVLRCASLVYGLRLVATGSAQAKRHPRTTDDAGLVEEARQAITAVLLSHRRAGRRSSTTPVGGAAPTAAPGPPVPSWAPGSPAAAAPVVAPPEPLIAAGWYLTADQRHYRWHDGTSWTAHVRPTQDESALPQP
ncbi:DUF2510 domain-containing protein [Cellulomonas sp. NPDC058312]|uniref:DUF2510 domain-containing protein n=1 Tax=Cellulomonas sp. NPDC058312 TaxID=3346441 RepID=UPI0036E9B9AB